MPNWPDRIPEPTRDGHPELRSRPARWSSATPTRRSQQAKSWESTGIDQLVFGIGPAPIEETLRTIELLGKHVIPKIDTDPEHRTSKQRKAAK